MTDDTTDIGTMSDEQLNALLRPEETPEPPPAEPEVQAAPPPEPAAEAQSEPQAAYKHVPLAELLEERGRRKEMQARLEEMEQRMAQYMAALQQGQQAQQEVPTPDFEADPIEYLRVQQDQVRQNLEALKAQQQQAEQRRQQEAQFGKMREFVGQDEKAFVASKPDYYEAVNHLRAVRQQQLAQQGLAPGQIAQVLTQDTVRLVQQAAEWGLSPAQHAYRMAQAAGWSPKPAAAPAATPATPPKSLGGTAGRPDDATPSLADMSRMTDQEFDKVFESYFRPS